MRDSPPARPTDAAGDDRLLWGVDLERVGIAAGGGDTHVGTIAEESRHGVEVLVETPVGAGVAQRIPRRVYQFVTRLRHQPAYVQPVEQRRRFVDPLLVVVVRDGAADEVNVWRRLHRIVNA